MVAPKPLADAEFCSVTGSWDRRARFYDLFEASDLRRGPHKEGLFRRIRGETLFVGVGTGIDIKHLPVGPDIIAVDNSSAMIAKSRARVENFSGRLSLVQGDAESLSFPNEAFDTVVTSCTMCSVPRPHQAFREFYRVLKPGGQLLMFEHVRSANPVLGLILDLMSIITRRRGTEMNRDTMRTASEAGFLLFNVQPVFLDIIIAAVAVKVAHPEDVAADSD
ncbi:MAG TPA: class I SAM-dependent methyltransferase [Terriglobia bacterium]|nr:class I SAM-dependent methyltransferase [Terriglobia bacterium]